MLSVKKIMRVYRQGNDLQKRLITELKTGSKQRRELVDALNTPRTTIYDNLKKLEKKGIVERYKVHNKERGRPKKFWKLTEDALKYSNLVRGVNHE